MSLFRTSIKPLYEDPVNKNGGEFRVSIRMEQREDSIDKLNKIWERLITDLITSEIPCSDLIAGIKINDKSDSEKEVFRMEIWTTSNDKYQVEPIKDYIIDALRAES